MKKSLLTLVAVFLTNIVINAQTTKTINVGSFNSVDISGDISVLLTTDGDESLTYELPENVDESQFEWENKNGVLVLKLKDQIVIGKGKKVKPTAKVTIVYDELEAISVSSKASILAEETLEAEILDVKLNTSANIAINIDVRSLDINANTSSKITLGGNVEYLTVKASSSAYVNTITMECDNALINTNTNAECYATAIKKFEAKATTNSNIFYKGEPEIVKTSNSTLGSVEHF